MKKNTVVFVYHALELGGAEKEMLAYVSHLSPARYSVHIVLTRADGALISSVPSHVQLHIAGGNSETPDIRHILRLSQILHTIHPDVVVGFMQDICFNVLAIRELFRFRYKIVISEQVVLSQWQQVKHTHLVKKILIKFLYRKADMIFAQAESIETDLKRNFGIDPEKILLVPSFVSPGSFAYRTQSGSGIKKYKPYFLYMGRLAPEKNIETLLRAFSRLHAVNKHIRLLIVGTGPHDMYDDVCGSLDIRNAVLFMNSTQTPEVYYRQALALVIPSLVEGRCRVMIEAMISGCPVISSDFAGHDSYISHMETGQVFPRYSDTDLAARLSYTVRHPKKISDIAKKAKQFITNAYVKKQQHNYAYRINSAFLAVLTDSGKRKMP